MHRVMQFFYKGWGHFQGLLNPLLFRVCDWFAQEYATIFMRASIGNICS